jgi:glycosyltransferase involved in cell wall biosynthesis
MKQAMKLRPGIVHAHNPTSLHYASGAAWLCRAKLVLTDHGQCAGVVRMPRSWEIRRLNALVSVSGDVDTRHREIFARADKHSVIYNGVEFTRPGTSRDDIRRQLDLPSGPTIIVVARVEPVKDHETLLRAVSLLHRQGMPVNLLIAGDGSESERLQAMLHDLGLNTERIRFLGFRTDVPELLHAADIFVLSSLGEGLPLAVLEAMGQGLAVVATSVGGVPELISTRKNGLLVPPRSPELLAEALAELIRKPEFRQQLGEAGAVRVKNNFSFDQMARQYEELYRSLLRPDTPMHSNGSLSEKFG